MKAFPDLNSYIDGDEIENLFSAGHLEETIQYRVVLPSHDIRWVEDKISLERKEEGGEEEEDDDDDDDEAKNRPRINGVISDITERKIIEEDLKSERDN